MKLTKSGPLTDREIDWLEEILMNYQVQIWFHPISG